MPADTNRSFRRTIDEMHEMASDMKETVIATRGMIELSREHMREADRILSRPT